MGTKVQLKSYLAEFYTMKNLNEAADSSGTQQYGDRASGSHPHHHGQQDHGQQTEQYNRFAVFDKESIKQAMLAQEAEFNFQLSELHRLYDKQKELMDGLMKKGPHGYQQAGTSGSVSHSTQIPSDDASKMWNIAHLAEMSATYNKVPVTANADKMFPLNILKETNAQRGLVLKDGDNMDSSHKSQSRRMFDLQLPANVYIDCEDAKKSKKETVGASSSANMFLNEIHAALKNNVKLALGTSASCNYRDDSWKSDLFSQNGVAACGLANLDEPSKENFFKPPAGLVSYDFVGQRTTLEEKQAHQLLTSSNASFPGLQSTFFGERHNEEGTYPNLLHADKETSKETGQTTDIRTLFSPDSSKEPFSIPSEVSQHKFKKPLDFLSPNPNKNETWYKQKQGHGIEISPLERSARSMPDPFSIPTSWLWTKPAGQSLPCFDGSYNWQRDGDLKSTPIIGANPPDGFNITSIQPAYSSASQLQFGLFSSGKPNCNNHCPQVLLNADNAVAGDSMGESSSGVLSWLKPKPAGMSSSHLELDFSKGYPQLVCSSEKTQEMEKGQSLFNLQELPSSSLANNEVSDGLSSKKIFGFNIFDKAQQIVTSTTNCSGKDENKESSLEIQNHLEGVDAKTRSSSFGKRINLNCDPSSWEIPDEDEILAIPLQDSAPRVVSEIDLEAPIGSQAEKPDDALAKEAAENILWILSNDLSRMNDTSPHGSVDTLNWFAEIVSSEANRAKESLDDEVDLFEKMTLELEETKPDEFWSRQLKLKDVKNDDDDQKNVAESLLFPKPRRGQGKKRRQRRDFQTDILPGLASLSRNEVTEDLQSFSALMKASGQSWQYGAKRRNAGRNRANSRAGGGQAGSSVAAAAAARASPPQPPVPDNAAVEADGGSMVGWGRTTRRCRRQRCPAVTNAAASRT